MDAQTFYNLYFKAKSHCSITKLIRNYARRTLQKSHPHLKGAQLQKTTEQLILKAHKDLEQNGYRFQPIGLTAWENCREEEEKREMISSSPSPDLQGVKQPTVSTSSAETSCLSSLSGPELSPKMRKRSLTYTIKGRKEELAAEKMKTEFVTCSSSPPPSSEVSQFMRKKSLSITGIPAPVESPKYATPRKSKLDELVKCDTQPEELNMELMTPNQQKLSKLDEKDSKIPGQQKLDFPETPKTVFGRNQVLRSSSTITKKRAFF